VLLVERLPLVRSGLKFWVEVQRTLSCDDGLAPTRTCHLWKTNAGDVNPIGIGSRDECGIGRTEQYWREVRQNNGDQDGEAAQESPSGANNATAAQETIARRVLDRSWPSSNT
jgi:hypothetical protein